MKKYLLILLSIGILIVLGLNIFFYWKRGPKGIAPNTVPLASLPSTVGQIQLTYQYNGELPSVLSSTPVYSIQEDLVLTTDRAQQIAKLFNVTTLPNIGDDIGGKVYTFQSETTSITIYPKPFRIDYFYSVTEELGAPLNESQLTTKAESFLSNLKILSERFSLKLVSLQPQQSDGLVLHNVNTLNQANRVKITFSAYSDSLPIIPKNRQTYPIELLLNLDGSVRKASITLIPDQLEEIGTAELTEPQAALDAINAGGGIISKLHDPTQAYTQLVPGDISLATLNSLEVVYLYDHDIQMLQPYYRFAGSAQTKQGETIEVEVLITALPQEVFKP